MKTKLLLLASLYFFCQPTISQINIELSNIKEKCDGTASIALTVWDGEMPYSFEWGSPDMYIEDDNWLSTLEFYQVTITNVPYGANEIVVIDSLNNSNTISFNVDEPPAIGAELVVTNPTSCENSCEGSISVLINQPCIDITLTPYGFCTTQVDPVLACDGMTYSNSCFGVVNAGITSWTNIDSNQPGSAYSYTFEWDDPDQQDTIMATGLCPGTYHVTVTRDAGFMSGPCVEVLTAVISSEAIPAITIDQVIPESGIEMNGQINVSISGGLPPYAFNWLLDGNTVSTDEDPSGLSAGTYTLLVTDSNDCIVESTQIVVESVVATNVIINQNTIHISPNPVNDFLQVNIEDQTIKVLGLSVININGQQINCPTKHKTTNNYTVDCSRLSSGIYFLSVQTAYGRINKKVIVF